MENSQWQKLKSSLIRGGGLDEGKRESNL